MHVTCPSGLEGDVRSLTVAEQNALLDPRAARDGLVVDRLLAACWSATGEPGPYTLGADGRLSFGDVLVGDRLHALLRIRAETYGEEYRFGVECPRRGCGERFEWEVGLDELPVRRLADSDLAAFAAGNRIETSLPRSGCRAWFRLLVGKDERRLAELIRRAPDRQLSTVLAYRVVEVEGVPDAERAAFLRTLPAADADHLIAEFEERDLGVETSIEVRCTACGHTTEVDLPFEAALLFPRSARGAREKRRRVVEDLAPSSR